MKFNLPLKSLGWFILLTFYSSLLNAQNSVPAGINYQAIARNSAGSVYYNQNIAVKISILQGSNPGILQYAERHTVTTNVFGLFNLKIGAGTPLNGSFSDITWNSANHYVKVEVDQILVKISVSNFSLSSIILY